MKIDFSRHAKRRMQLYKIDENDVKITIENVLSNEGITSGKHEKVNQDLSEKYGYPLKVVFLIEDEDIIVLTSYPLKKERGK
ncbi:MAG: DUF4258 domain-containing protein [Nitrospiraceae bacterium]|nr:DUF4258 domain-containing protein [Nitrospiraceae bacterium]